jgi:uncharacterized protein (TIGR02145 family)
MMVDGKWSDDNRNSTGWSEPSSYGTNTGSANTNNGGRGTGYRGICPPNWHVPTDGEWGDILNAIETGTKNHNMSTSWIGTNAGKYLKSACIGISSDTDPLWIDNANNKGTDLYGFRVLPSGYRNTNGSGFIYRSNEGGFWSSSAYSDTIAWRRAFGYSNATVYRANHSRSYGFSVRCIRDN